VIKKKEIELAKSNELMTRLDEIPEPVLSVRQFITLHFDALRRSGKSLKALHHFLLNNGIDVGGFQYFSALYNKEKRARIPGGEEEVNANND